MTHIINDSVCVRFMIRLQMSCDLCPVIILRTEVLNCHL